MTPSLQQESERLVRSWAQHDAAMLGDYLVADVEDPRVNVQSVLTRHFLLFAAFGDRYAALATEELRFAATMNWLLALSRDAGVNPAALWHGLRVGADNGEGVEIPPFIGSAFRRLPCRAGGSEIPNYLESALRGATSGERFEWPLPEVGVFQRLWSEALRGESPTGLSVLEPACGSANDYRFLESYGLARLFRYAGFDLSEKNVANARGMFPEACFERGNLFEIAASEGAFDFCYVHDLFEHLSPEGRDRAVAELCRVTRTAACVGFFNMDEIAEDVVQPVDEYYWNTLSMERARERFGAHGFRAQVIHIGTFLRARTGCATTHNPHAYTFVLGREGMTAPAPG